MVAELGYVRSPDAVGVDVLGPRDRGTAGPAEAFLSSVSLDQKSTLPPVSVDEKPSGFLSSLFHKHQTPLGKLFPGESFAPPKVGHDLTFDASKPIPGGAFGEAKGKLEVAQDALNDQRANLDDHLMKARSEAMGVMKELAPKMGLDPSAVDRYVANSNSGLGVVASVVADAVIGGGTFATAGRGSSLFYEINNGRKNLTAAEFKSLVTKAREELASRSSPQPDQRQNIVSEPVDPQKGLIAGAQEPVQPQWGNPNFTDKDLENLLTKTQPEEIALDKTQDLLDDIADNHLYVENNYGSTGDLVAKAEAEAQWNPEMQKRLAGLQAAPKVASETPEAVMVEARGEEVASSKIRLKDSSNFRVDGDTVDLVAELLRRDNSIPRPQPRSEAVPALGLT